MPQECLEVLGIPNIIAFLTKPDLDAESKSLSASLLISIGNAGPVYRSFAKNHGIFEALCNWAQSTDNERHHSKIQVLESSPQTRALFPVAFMLRHWQNCLQLFARQPTSPDAEAAGEGNAVLLLLHVSRIVVGSHALHTRPSSHRAANAVLLPRPQPNHSV